MSIAHGPMPVPNSVYVARRAVACVVTLTDAMPKTRENTPGSVEFTVTATVSGAVAPVDWETVKLYVPRESFFWSNVLSDDCIELLVALGSCCAPASAAASAASWLLRFST